MENFQSIQVTLPLWQIALLGIIALVCLLTSRLKLGLMANFIFAAYWALLKQFTQDGSTVMHFQAFDALYLFIGLSLATVFLIYLFFMTSD
jgi:hypothetical protein